MQTLLFHDPGHFHAALTLRAASPRVARTVHVYAPAGPELDAFRALIESFNAREAAPTDWDLQVHEGEGSLDRLIDERRGEVVVLAGRNDGKLATIRRLHDAGFHTLADKPWITSPAALADLEAVTAGPPLAIDIMLSPHDTLPRLTRLIAGTESVFGRFVEGGEAPAIETYSLHHLYKIVNGEPLRRPPWFYDVRVQGDGLVDIHSHMVDQAQRLLGPEHAYDYAADFALDRARRWSTPVPLALFSDSTGEAAFPEYLAGAVEDGVLDLACNGEIDYRLRGLRVRQKAEWGAREPEGGGDVVGARLRGSGATVRVVQGPETGYRSELHLEDPGSGGLEDRIRAALDAWRQDFPSLDLATSDIGFQLLIPDTLRIGHEAQFPMVLDNFLDLVEAGVWPAHLAGRIRSRYTLLARAHERAVAAG